MTERVLWAVRWAAKEDGGAELWWTGRKSPEWSSKPERTLENREAAYKFAADMMGRSFGDQVFHVVRVKLKVEELFDVRQCEVLGRWMICDKCNGKHLNHYETKELRHKGRTVGRVGVMFNVDEKCRVIRMSIDTRWTEDL